MGFFVAVVVFLTKKCLMLISINMFDLAMTYEVDRALKANNLFTSPVFSLS